MQVALHPGTKVDAEVDVAVIGASPAGLRAAWAAAEGGARVALFERQERIGDPEPPAVVAFDFLWAAAFEPPASAVRRRLAGVDLVAPGGSTLRVDAPLRLLRRSVLDPWLAEQARAAGAAVYTGARDLEVTSGGEVRSALGVVAPRVVVYADGARSLAAHRVRPTRNLDALTWGGALRVRAPGAGEADALRIGLGGHLPGGRSQLTPLGDDEWAHWTFARSDTGAGFEALSRATLARDAKALGWPESVVGEAHWVGAAPDSVYTVPHELAGPDLLVTGGAAGQGGLEAGLAAGEAAGAAAARATRGARLDPSALYAYEADWKAANLGAYEALHRTTERMMRVPDAHLDALFAAWRGRSIPIRDLAGLAHPSVARRVEAAARALVRRPLAAPVAARLGWRLLVG